MTAGPTDDQLIEAARRAETHLREAVRAGGFAVALSGGGHRAMLAAFGSLLALADRGLNERVLQVASVSGGSITNAITAQRCDFRTVTTEEYEQIVADGVQTIIRRGVLTKGWINAVVVSALALVVIPTVVSGQVGVPTWIGLALGVVLAATMFLFAGHLIQFLLDRRLLRAGGITPSGSVTDRPKVWITFSVRRIWLPGYRSMCLPLTAACFGVELGTSRRLSTRAPGSAIKP